MIPNTPGGIPALARLDAERVVALAVWIGRVGMAPKGRMHGPVG